MKLKQPHRSRKPVIFGLRTLRKISAVAISTKRENSFNPPLPEAELKMGTRLGIDSHADTSCVNKHIYVEAIVEGMTVDAIPFDESIGHLTDLPILNAVYAADNMTR